MRIFFCIVILVTVAFSHVGLAQSASKLKTNAKDTVEVEEWSVAWEGGPMGLRKYKTLGKEYAYRMSELDVEPQYRDGLEKLNGCIIKEIQRLYSHAQKPTQLTFVIGYRGELTDFTVIWAERPDIDKLLIKYLKSLPKWTPGIKNKKYVRVRYELQYQW